MALFLIVDFAHCKFVDGAFWFRFVGSPELVSAVGFVKRYQPLGSEIGQQVIETLATDEHFVGRKADADLTIRSLWAMLAYPEPGRVLPARFAPRPPTHLRGRAER